MYKFICKIMFINIFICFVFSEGGCTVIHVGPSLNNGAHDIGADVPLDRSRNNTKVSKN